MFILDWNSIFGLKRHSRLKISILGPVFFAAKEGAPNEKAILD